MLYNYYLWLGCSRHKLSWWLVGLLNSVVICVMIVVCIGFVRQLNYLV